MIMNSPIREPVRRPRRVALAVAAAGLAAAGLVGTTAVALADDRPGSDPRAVSTNGQMNRPTNGPTIAPTTEPTVPPTVAPTSTPTSPPPGDRFARTELFFGTDKPGPDVTDAQFRGFVNRVVTPRFPDGLTQYDAFGQFRDSTNRIVRERAKVIILLYPVDVAGPSSIEIEEIRDAYEVQFEQESVLRADSVDLVSF